MRARAFVVVAILALACKGEQELIAREGALKQNLAAMRQGIAKYKAEKGHYPASLDELAPNYVRRIPTDPFTQKADWRVTTEETVQPSADFQTTTVAAPASVVIDVHSSAPGADRNGVPYANY